MSEEVQSEVTSNPDDAGNSGNVVNEQMGEINKTIQQLGQNQVALQQMLANQMQAPQPAPVEDTRGTVTISDNDLESLSRSEFATYLEGNLIKAVAENLKPVTDKINSVESNVNSRNLTQQVESAKVKYKDFENFSQEILGLHKSHKTLNVDQLYHLARQMSPDKIIKEEVVIEPAPVNKPMLGLFPSSSAVRDPEHKSNMNPKDAGEAAWETIFGDG